MKKAFLITAALFFLLGCILIYQNITYNDKKLHIVICDVGQGDAIFIRTPQGSDILIDGGPDNKVLQCLAKHMPFWDRDLELVILTHPHSDHFTGLFSVLKTYKVKVFATEDLENKTLGFEGFMQTIKNQAISTRFIFAGDKFSLKDGVKFEIAGPTEEFLRETSPGGMIGESDEFASLLTKVEYGKFSLLLTGDSQAGELREAIDKDYLDKISALQIPHHGSRFGLTAEILDSLQPKLAVISVGAKNKYSHPAAFTLELLRNNNIKTLRTDEHGDIEIISDGSNWTVKKGAGFIAF